MIGGMGFIRSYDWHSNTFLTSLISPSGYIALGASPPTSGAIRIDSSSYSDTILSATGTAGSSFKITQDGNGVNLNAVTNIPLRFYTFNINRWNIVTEASGTASLQSIQNIARIVGGSTNGLAIRNSANTRDNFRVYDDGSTAILTDGTQSAFISASSISGERTAGGIFGGGSSLGTWVTSGGSATAGILTGISYLNTTDGQRSALEVAVVAGAGVFGTLKLMRSGGSVVIGTDPGGSEQLRVGSTVRTGGSVVVASAASIGWGSRSIIRSPIDSRIKFVNAAETGFSGIDRGQSAGETSIYDLQKAVTAIADATPTDVLTVTVPNSVQTASLKVTLKGALGAGGAIGADEATGNVTYDIAIARTAGVNAVAVASAAYGSAMANVAGAATITVTAAVSAIAGAVGAVNTFTVQVTITKGSGASAANKGRLFFQDNGAGKTQLMVIFATGAAQQVAIEP